MKGIASPAVLLLSLALSGGAVGQQTTDRIEGRITDPKGQPLAYVSIGVPGTPIGTVSEENGQFTLYKTDKLGDNDSVRFSLIGYQPRTLTWRDLRQSATTGAIQLEQAARLLNEVKVVGRQVVVKTLGKESYKSLMATNFALSNKPRQNLGAEIGRRFDLPNRACRLEKYRFCMGTNFDTVTFRINVYAVNGMRNLLPQNIYQTVSGKYNGWVEVDLTPYNIVVNENVIVSLQWVDNTPNGTYLQMPMHMPAPVVHYYKYGSQDRWRKFVGMTTTMNLTIAYEKRKGDRVDKDEELAVIE
mgnify:CR=1 FL=1